jgi:ATP-dependent Clp protease adaptor protein ClpS
MPAVGSDAKEITMSDELRRREVLARKRDDKHDDDGAGGGRPSDGDTVVERRTRPETRTKKPPMYKVVLLNDDYTPMEFVVEILKVVFHKRHAEATRIMLHVHQNGMGVAGVFPYEIAETKVRTVDELARESEFPLKCVMEKA